MVTCVAVDTIGPLRKHFFSSLVHIVRCASIVSSHAKEISYSISGSWFKPWIIVLGSPDLGQNAVRGSTGSP